MLHARCVKPPYSRTTLATATFINFQLQHIFIRVRTLIPSGCPPRLCTVPCSRRARHIVHRHSSDLVACCTLAVSKPSFSRTTYTTLLYMYMHISLRWESHMHVHRCTPLLARLAWPVACSACLSSHNSHCSINSSNILIYPQYFSS